MSTSLKQRIANACTSAEARPQLEALLASVRENLTKTDQRLDQLLLRLLILAVTLVLLQGAAITELNVGPARVADLAIVYALIPIAMGYTYYQATATLALRRLLIECFDAGIKIAYPALYALDLEMYMQPPSAPSLQRIVFHHSRGVSRRLLDAFTLLQGIIVVIVPVLFVLYAFWSMFRKLGGANVWAWLSTLIAIGCYCRPLCKFCRIKPSLMVRETTRRAPNY